MKIDIHTHGSFKVLKFEDELAIIADLSELKFLIDGYIKQGKRKIAVAFSEASYIYSGAIAVLVECRKELVENSGGRLCIIEPNEDIKSVFSISNLDKILEIYDSEDDLPED